jgi:hypothetical protein
MSPEPKKPLLPTDVSAASYRKYSLLMLYIVLVVTGLLMTQPLLIFAQEKFFNASGGECVTDAERDTDDCKRASGRLAGVTGARCLANLWLRGRFPGSLHRDPTTKLLECCDSDRGC